MANSSELFGVPVIMAICYLIIEVYKYAVNSNQKYMRFIPLIGGLLGMILGIVAYYCAKDIMASQNIISAMFIGLSSGLASTGTHQIFKQFTKSTQIQSPQIEQQIKDD